MAVDDDGLLPSHALLEKVMGHLIATLLCAMERPVSAALCMVWME